MQIFRSLRKLKFHRDYNQKLSTLLTLAKDYIVCIRIKLYKYFKAHDVAYEVNPERVP